MRIKKLNEENKMHKKIICNRIAMQIGVVGAFGPPCHLSRPLDTLTCGTGDPPQIQYPPVGQTRILSITK